MQKPSLPTRPRGAELIKAITPEWLARFYDCVAWAMEHPRGDGRTVRNLPGGMLEALVRRGSGDESAPVDNEPDAVLAVVVSGSAAAGYVVDLYADGVGSEKTGGGRLFLPEVALAGDLPSGSRILAHRSQLEITGGNES